MGRICLLCLSLPSAQWAVPLSCCPRLWSCAAWGGGGREGLGSSWGAGEWDALLCTWRGGSAAESLSFLSQGTGGISQEPTGAWAAPAERGPGGLGWGQRLPTQAGPALCPGPHGPRAASAQATCVPLCPVQRRRRAEALQSRAYRRAQVTGPCGLRERPPACVSMCLLHPRGQGLRCTRCWAGHRRHGGDQSSTTTSLPGQHVGVDRESASKRVGCGKGRPGRQEGRAWARAAQSWGGGAMESWSRGAWPGDSRRTGPEAAARRAGRRPVGGGGAWRPQLDSGFDPEWGSMRRGSPRGRPASLAAVKRANVAQGRNRKASEATTACGQMGHVKFPIPNKF